MPQPSSTGPSLLNRPPNPLGASTCSTRSDGGGLCQVSCKGASSSPHLRSTVSGHVETGELGLLARLRALNASSEVISQLGQPMHTSIGGQASAP
ncbi:unnamed protein product [Protopolystoma xenopodis]|uniref:Uncharacterized protein n=1 Tax=Protopolystoma xenopodis TaxID=117903 RepID=A0A448WYB7_9PLAT|nr:unnamed protein product [Protopolystoma xenopodis]